MFDVEAWPAGLSGLAAALDAGVDAAVVCADTSDHGLVARLQGLELLKARVELAGLEVVAELGRREEARLAYARARVPDYAGEDTVWECLPEEVAAALGVSVAAACRRVGLALAVHGHLPMLGVALAEGRTDVSRAGLLVEETAVLAPQVAARVVAELLPRARTWTWGRLAHRVRAAVLAADPAAAGRAHARARRGRRVWLRPLGQGMSELGAVLGADEATCAWAHLSDLAHHLTDTPTPTDTSPTDQTGQGRGAVRTIDEARADVFVDLLCEEATTSTGLPAGTGQTGGGTGQTSGAAAGSGAGATRAGATRAGGGRARLGALVNITVPFDTLLTGGTAPGELAMQGPVAAQVARAAALRALAAGAAWRLIGVGGEATAAATTTATYRPPPWLAELVAVRDRTCRFPGCRRPAHQCDLDHTLAYPQGQTTLTNLACLCRRHHRLKTHTRWRLDQDDHGRLTWTTPTGHTYPTDPHDWPTPTDTHAPPPETGPPAHPPAASTHNTGAA